MNITPVSYNYNCNVRRNAKTRSNPSFQHLRILSEEHWDKDVLEAIKNNAEIKKLEKYLWEKKNSVLELTQANYGQTDPHTHLSEGMSVECTYDRHSRTDGLSASIVQRTTKEKLLAELKKFKSAGFIRSIEEEEKSLLKSLKSDISSIKRRGHVHHERMIKVKPQKESGFIAFLKKIFN